ncbi:MAG: hypothetical protein WAL58_07575 [Terriglobales bacterium]|jgi:hypothetical protein
MRLAYALALALCLSFSAAASWQQDPTAGAKSGQSPDPLSPAENPTLQQFPVDTTLTPEQKAAVRLEKKQTNSSATGATKKRRQRPAPPPPGTPKKIVVREGGASEPAEQIVPGMTPAEALRQRQNAEQWLGSTDLQLKQLAGRNLNPQQQETLGQIRNYMEGARGALQEGDVRRASTLAEKAHLLADDLLKH